MINFNEVDVAINGTGIVAQSASIEVSNSLSPIRSLGKRGTHNIAADGVILTKIQIDYLPLLCSEPIFDNSEIIKNLESTEDYNGVTIVVGGITGFNCYLQNHSYSIVPNQIVRASASFVSFEAVSGDLVVATGKYTYNTDNSFAHAWSTYILGTGVSDYFDVPTYDFSYNFQANWEPVYKIGEETPSDVLFLDAQQTMDFTRDDFTNITWSGEFACDSFLDCLESDNVQLLNVAFLCDTGIDDCVINMSVSGAKVTNSSLSVQLDDIAKVKTTIIRYY